MMREARNSYFLLVISLAAIFSTGCGPGVVTRPMRFVDDRDLFVQQKGPGRDPTSKQVPCAIYVKTLEDRRSSMAFFSEYAQLETFAKSVPQWVREGVLSLGQHGYIVHFESVGMPPPSMLTINLTVQKAYLRHLSTVMSAVVVLAAEYEKNGAVIHSKVYRGQDTGINWANTADEMEGAMNRALTSVLADFAVDVDLLCSP